LTRRRIASPRSSPGPRYDATLVRFALSNEALKTSCTASPARVARSRSAMATVAASSSSTQGPAITSSRWPRPQA